jgi:hypothetical protein
LANVPQDFLVYLGKVFGITAVVIDFWELLQILAKTCKNFQMDR